LSKSRQNLRQISAGQITPGLGIWIAFGSHGATVGQKLGKPWVNVQHCQPLRIAKSSGKSEGAYGATNKRNEGLPIPSECPKYGRNRVYLNARTFVNSRAVVRHWVR